MTPPDFRNWATDSVTTIYPAWTSEPPTEAGWYVCEIDDGPGSGYVLHTIYRGYEGAVMLRRPGHPTVDMRGIQWPSHYRWYGPINPPAEDTP